MNTKAQQAPQEQPIEASATDTVNFDFDQWSVEVRRQLLASLNKRAARQYSDSQ